MEINKWDGKTNSKEILTALLLLIDEDDEAKARTTSYGDFGKYLQKLYKGSGAGNGEVTVESFKGNLRVTLRKKHIAYQLTWNKAAKLIHGYLHKEEKRNV